ncbi:catalase family protein [Sphingomonas nostoxanthinifaciens]|uniref:catalase family protein n=1 Tax=Sphingomonas nostoxanthinifaciens TaxID=2872652 RepID=UPI001CC204D3|nr:catalase family protein [Sphingomonas nostoxanthinifaciens]UAK24008.1 catalase family protein [Sphingomonas nostoxanthinifaciens]
MVAAPIPYSADAEQLDSDEGETGEGLNTALHGILETTSKDYGHAVRAVHAKSHGLLSAELTVHDGLPAELAQGLFATPGTHRAIMRFSTNPGDILDDSISVPRGLGIKVLGVDGARVEGSEGDTTQNFIMVNGPVFGAPKGKPFLANLKLLAKTTDTAEGAKKALSAVLQATNAALSAVGIDSAAIKQLGGAPQVHPLGETYFSQVPFRYGDYIAKFQLVPMSPLLKEVSGTTIVTTGRPDALREDIAETMIEGEGVWEFRVQLQRDRAKQPVEDASALWDEAEAPFVTVATLRAGPQVSWSHDRAAVVDDQMSFSIWHGLAAHRPLGQINRLRKDAYEMSSRFRGHFNGCPMHEPKADEPLPA